MAKSYPVYNYDLADEILEGLQEFSVDKFANSLAGRIKDKNDAELSSLLGEAFGEYARNKARSAIKLGSVYKDRTAEVMEEVAAKTGIYFPCIPQRYLELCMLATRPGDKWKINEANPARFTFTVSECTFRRALAEKIGTDLACGENCLSLLNTIYQELNLEVEVSLSRDSADSCRFVSVFKGKK